MLTSRNLIKTKSKSMSKSKFNTKTLSIIAVLAVLFVLGFTIGTKFSHDSSRLSVMELSDSQSIKITMPAVDGSGNGVIGSLKTTIRPGSGQVLVDVNNVLAHFDTQFSGRIAAQAASKYMNISLDNIDIIYSLNADPGVDVVEGSSAGASMALSVVTLLQNRTFDKNVTITGTIDKNGNIGPVGAIIEKAQVSKQNGATIFLVPQGQSGQATTVKADRKCKNLDFFEYCTINYNKQILNIGEKLGINIYEVKNIEEALKYFSKDYL